MHITAELMNIPSEDLLQTIIRYYNNFTVLLYFRYNNIVITSLKTSIVYALHALKHATNKYIKYITGMDCMWGPYSSLPVWPVVFYCLILTPK